MAPTAAAKQLHHGNILRVKAPAVRPGAGPHESHLRVVRVNVRGDAALVLT